MLKRLALFKSLGLQVAFVVGVAGVLLFGVKPLLEHPHGSAPGVALTDLTGVPALQARFNQDVGTPRLILLLSPT
ncbi:MAG TPA: hypothetical protein VKY74_13895 [Chloroflexia bacterium]|nr:hypothetical protein [Chloroflexia bacterium]